MDSPFNATKLNMDIADHEESFRGCRAQSDQEYRTMRAGWVINRVLFFILIPQKKVRERRKENGVIHSASLVWLIGKCGGGKALSQKTGRRWQENNEKRAENAIGNYPEQPEK